MEPVFFGESDRQLYGVYHPPSSGRYRDAAVLLCYPMGQEYMRIHRAYRQLADLLAEQGYHVLRFDYTCTGDSHGDQQDMNFQHWLNDAEIAADELMGLSGASQLCLFGARVGGIVAALLAGKIAISRLVLWEPCESVAQQADGMRIRISKLESEANFVESNGGIHFNGFYFSPEFLKSSALLTLNNLVQSKDSIRTLIVFSEQSPKVAKFDSIFTKIGYSVTTKIIECLADWYELDDVGGVFLPQQTLHGISVWLSEG